MIDEKCIRSSKVELNQTVLFTPEEEYEQIKEWQTHCNKKALTNLLVSLHPYIHKLCLKFYNMLIDQEYFIEFDDILQTAYMGCINGINNYDINYPSKSMNFRYFLKLYIDDAHKKLGYKNWFVVRPIQNTLNLSLFYKLLSDSFENDVTYTKKYEDQYDCDRAYILKFKQTMFSKNIHINENNDYAYLMQQKCEYSMDYYTFENALIRNEVKNILDKALETITNIDRYIISQHFMKNRSLADIGRELGCSRERVRQRCHRALVRIKKYFIKNKFDDYALFG